jgi:uncharacterized membrane protein
MIFSVYGGFAGVALHIHLMFAIGLVMMAIFAFVYFVPYRALRGAVAGQDWPQGGRALASIRRLVGINTVLGLINVAIASGGVYWLAG